MGGNVEQKIEDKTILEDEFKLPVATDPIAGMEGVHKKGTAISDHFGLTYEDEDYDNKWDVNNDGIIDQKDIDKARDQGKTSLIEGDPFEFTYRNDRFDPSRDEFAQYVETTGGFDELINRWKSDRNLTAEQEEKFDENYSMYFDSYDPTELEFAGEARDTLKAKIDDVLASAEKAQITTKEGLETAKRGAEDDYTRGRRKASRLTGTTLADIRKERDKERIKSGAARTGFAGRRAPGEGRRGAFRDLLTQREDLESALNLSGEQYETGMKRATDVFSAAQASHQQGLSGADLGYERDVYSFWKDQESDFMDALDALFIKIDA